MTTVIHEKIGQQACLVHMKLGQCYLQRSLQNMLPLRSRMGIRVLHVKQQEGRENKVRAACRVVESAVLLAVRIAPVAQQGDKQLRVNTVSHKSITQSCRFIPIGAGRELMRAVRPDALGLEQGGGYVNVCQLALPHWTYRHLWRSQSRHQPHRAVLHDFGEPATS